MIQRSFLQAKHWQLFLLLFGVPFLFQMLMMGFTFSQVFAEKQPDFDALYSQMIMLNGVMMILIVTFFGWLWSVGLGLQAKIPSEVSMPVTRFKAFVIFPFLYILLIVGGMLYVSSGTSELEAMETFPVNPMIFLLIIPFHFFAMFCILYDFYFVAKTIKTVELQRKVTFGDFIGEFFMIWFYPIGIWIVQPKINEMSA
ncbi:MAG: hypothetical protein AAF587_36465 [Bacteroidota bacterium]